ncbi:NADH-quinone oxidoreductase subunit D [Streptomyces piniterrae]|uniref:NADH-quinone oxidoreductase subunit D n=1 Tax=Streptomyces piniterrae TaxID=2571125 RepID=A0A4U0MV99_9ACTN|nr:proton-conducting transporter membrane subunit [Streptomyces piniterrae]TJZ44492.1 NADH-quinone oxidoreductase subunit D [Streptomyces piniterrae]
MAAGELLPLVVAVPLLGSAVLVAAGRRLTRIAADALGAAFAAGTVALCVFALIGVLEGPAVAWAGGWRPKDGLGVGIALVGDPLGVGLAALASVVTVAAFVYSWRYLEEPPPRHAGGFPALLLLFQAGMCGFTLTGDLFNAFVFFELMSVVAYALTGYRVEEPRPLQGALAFGIVNSLGGYCMLLGIALLYARTGELGMAQIGRALGTGEPDALVLAAFVLVMTGLLIKAAAVPFHFWLPDAHAVAPTPVCMVLSGVMVELGVYGAARVYWTVFAGPGGVSHSSCTRTLLVIGVATAVLGAAMCWQQRHLKRLLAFSTIGHVGLFLIGVAVLTPEGVSGTALYVLGHAGAKAALFACVGILLARYGSVDEYELYGRGRELRLVGVLFGVGALALAGVPPFGTGLGKAVAEEAAGQQAPWLPAVFVLVSAVTGGAVLRAGLRVFGGAGPRPPAEKADGEPETSGAEEEPETGDRLGRVPGTMLAVPVALLAGALAVGVLPGFAAAVGAAGDHFADHTGYLGTVLGSGSALSHVSASPHWTAAGVVLDLVSTALAIGCAALAVWRPGRTGHPGASGWWTPIRRMQSGHIGDYVAWALAGVALLAVLTVPGMLL